MAMLSHKEPANLVEIRDLSYYRGKRAIFDGLSLNIPRGTVSAIMGPSGTGKTTLLNLITGLSVFKQMEQT